MAKIIVQDTEIAVSNVNGEDYTTSISFKQKKSMYHHFSSIKAFVFTYFIIFIICLSVAWGQMFLIWVKILSNDSSGVLSHLKCSRPYNCSGVVSRDHPQPYSWLCLSTFWRKYFSSSYSRDITSFGGKRLCSSV